MQLAADSLTLDEMVSHALRRDSEKIAIVSGGLTMTRGQIDDAVSRLAAVLSAKVRRDDVCGVCMTRTPDAVIAMLAVMRAGAAYLPLDPTFPDSRLAYIVEDACPSLILTENELEPLVARVAAPVERLLVRELLSGGEGRQTGMRESSSRPSDLAYVLYTSGSSGKPKGVEIEHRSVVNLLQSMSTEPGLDSQDVFCAVTTFSFDISVLELFLPLAVGAQLVLAGSEEAAEPRALGDLLLRRNATVMQATPTLWRTLLDTGWQPFGPFKALVGGERLPKDLARRMLDSWIELWNMYGPTETTVWSTCARIDPHAERIVIGRPIANTRIHVLDSELRPLPTGVFGELWIAGRGVARGYRGRPDLTAERFRPDPDGTSSDARMYRTGDQGRRLTDGSFECRGRLDDQVKIRGYRVELGEVESALLACPGVGAAAARVWQMGATDARLVGYVRPLDGHAAIPQEITAKLRTDLPAYMVPQFIIVVESLPMTPNGKLDRARLPDPGAENGAAQRHVEPDGPIESAVARIFSEVLSVPRVSADASFFDIGGHSVLAIRAVARIKSEFGVELKLRTFFESPSPRSIARSIQGSASWRAVPAGEIEEVSF
jgi:amino acid adenylation domain-containing protein